MFNKIDAVFDKSTNTTTFVYEPLRRGGVYLDPILKKQVGGNHYKQGIQPWEYIQANDLNFWEGNVVKYTTRHKKKAKKEDLEKAIHNLEYLVANYDEVYK